MALIRTIEEVKEVLNISVLNDVSSLPDFDTAGELFLKPILGEALYASLETAYVNDTLSPLQEKLLLKVKKPLAPFAYMISAGLMNVVLTDTGWRQISTTEMPAAFKWQFQFALDDLKTMAYNALEELFRYLIANKTALGWDDSRRKKTLITDGISFSDCYVLHQPLRTFFLLQPVMVKVEDLYIKKAIGETFFADLKSKASFSTEEKELVQTLKMSIAHFTIKHAIESMPVLKSEAGFTITTAGMDKDSAQGTQGTARSELLEGEKAAAERDGQQYLKDAKNLLNGLASSTVFPLYFASSIYKPIVTEKPSLNAGKKTFRF